MNGPFASDDMDSNLADYCIGKNVIYVTFNWSFAEQGFVTMLQLAEKHGVGFFEVSSDNAVILFPDNGTLVAIDDPIDEQGKKPWWKFWQK